MAMEAGAMLERFILPSLLPPPARPENLPPPLSPTGLTLHGTGVGIHHSPLRSSSPADGISGEPHASDEVSGETHGGKHQIFGEFHRQMQGDRKIERKKIRKKDSGKTHGEMQRSNDTRGERKITSKTHVDQRDSSKVPISETIGGKISLSHGSESSRARKTAKIINAKVEMTQLKNSKIPRRKMSPIVSRVSYNEYSCKKKSTIACWNFKVS